MSETASEQRGTQKGFAIVLGLYGVLGAAICGVLPAYGRWFDALGVDLHAHTEHLLWLSVNPIVGQALLLALIGPLAVAEVIERPARHRREAIHLALQLLATSVAVAVVVAIFFACCPPLIVKL